MNLKKKLERYLRVNLLGPGPSSYEKRIYRAAVSQRLRNTALEQRNTTGVMVRQFALHVAVMSCVTYRKGLLLYRVAVRNWRNVASRVWRRCNSWVLKCIQEVIGWKPQLSGSSSVRVVCMGAYILTFLLSRADLRPSFRFLSLLVNDRCWIYDATVGQTTILQCTSFVLFTLSCHKNSSALTVLLSQYFYMKSSLRLTGHIVKRAFAFAVDRHPRPVLSSTVSQLFPFQDHV